MNARVVSAHTAESVVSMNRLAASQWPEPRHGLDYHAKPVTRMSQPVGADVDTGELIAARLPQVLGMHDASHGSQVWSCPREPSRGNQCLGRAQDARDDSMRTCRAR